jgi:hypothetical protein
MSSVLFLAGCGVAVGLGIDSLLFFLFTMAGIAGAVWMAEVPLVAAGMWLYWKRVPREGRRESGGPRLSLAAKIAGIALSVEFVLMLVSFFKLSCINPHGGWDAWSIWNLRARYLAGGEASWRYAVSKQIMLQHPDYPLLTSSVIAHAWKYCDSMKAAVPVTVALVFLLATVLVLVTGLTWLRSTMAGLCAGAMLLAVPAWTRLSAAQYADVPLGFYFLCTLALLCASRIDHRMAVLAGVTASLSAWTKDEGLLFTGLCVVVTLVLFGPRRASMTLAGALPVLLFVVWFKLRIAPGVDPMWHQSAGAMLAKVADGGRYARIAVEFAKGAAVVPELLLLPLFGLALGFKVNRETAGCMAIVGLMLVGYCGVYVVSPYPLEWYLRASVDRLYLQLLPGLLFGWFYAASDNPAAAS